MDHKSKFLIVGSNSPYAIERYYVQGFKKLGVECSSFWTQGPFLEYYNKNLLNKILYRIGLSSILKNINADLINYYLAYKPNVIVVFKGLEIYPSTLQKFKDYGSKIVNYNPDHPFSFHGRGSGNRLT